MEQKPKLLDQMRDAIRRRHFTYRTEQTYLSWARRYILFHGKRHPAEMGEALLRLGSCRPKYSERGGRFTPKSLAD